MPELTPLEIAEAKASALADVVNTLLTELAVARALLARRAKEGAADAPSV